MIAHTRIQSPFITHSQSPLLAAIGTEQRRRQGLFLSDEDWRNLLEEPKVVIGDLEGLLTPRIATGLLHLEKV
jgi:hypothetical protein